MGHQTRRAQEGQTRAAIRKEYEKLSVKYEKANIGYSTALAILKTNLNNPTFETETKRLRMLN